MNPFSRQKAELRSLSVLVQNISDFCQEYKKAPCFSGKAEGFFQLLL